MVKLTDEQQAFWDQFCAETKHQGKPFNAEYFGGTDVADELLGLVLKGQKQATCMLARWINLYPEIEPKIGNLTIILDAKEKPHCVIKTTKVHIAPVNSVTKEFAWREGEGERTREDWLRIHNKFFEAEAKEYGFDYTPEDPAIFEEFEMVWPAPKSVT